MSVRYYADQRDKARRLNRRLAKDVLIIAALGGMPDSYWLTDARIKRACKVLDWTPEKARTWAEGQS